MISALLLLVAARPQAGSSFSKQWTDVRTAISNSYYARKSRAGEMNRLFSTYGPKISGSKSDSEFETNVNAMITAFGDSHFSYLTKSDQGWYLMDSLSRGENADEMPHIGAWFRKVAEGFEVQMVLDGMPAMTAGIRKGDIVQEIDGRSFTPIESLRSSVGSSVELTLLRANKPIKKMVKVLSQRAFTMFLQASTNSSRVIEDNGRHIGYFHLWTMASHSFQDALSAAVYGKLKNTDGFILDLRDGFGGRPEGYGDPFFRPEVQLTWALGENRTYELFGYGRPLVTLVNGGSRSAKEVFSYILKTSKRATLVGSTTAGNVLGTSPLKLASGAYIEIPIADVYTDGLRLEGKGVSPDLIVPQEVDSDGRDLDLAAGLGRLKGIPSYHRLNQEQARNSVTLKGATAIF